MKVSVITPTRDRPQMLERLIRLYLAQDYTDKELIIICDKEEDLPDMGDILTGHKIFAVLGSGSIGRKRNFGNDFADGRIILHMDTDDLYAPDWISTQVKALVTSGASIVGLSNAYFHRTKDNALFEYLAKSNVPYVCGATMAYWKSTWDRRRFQDISEGEDLHFQQNNGKVAAHNYTTGFMATIHDSNTCSHKAVVHMTRIHSDLADPYIKDFYKSLDL